MAADTPGLTPAVASVTTVPDLPAATDPALPSTIGTVIAGFFLPLIASIVAGFVVLVAAAIPGVAAHGGIMNRAFLSAPGIAGMFLLQNALLAYWAWRLACNCPPPARTWLRLTPVRVSPLDVVLLLVLATGVFAFGGLASYWGRQLGLAADTKLFAAIVKMFQAPGIGWLALVIAMGVGPGIGEEMWARGYLLRAFEARQGTRRAILASALLFAVLHLNPAQIVFALPFGLVFGWLAVRMNSILPGMLCHAFVNSGVNLIRAIEVRKPGYVMDLHPTLHAKNLVEALAAIVAGLIAGLWLERRFRAAKAAEMSSQPSPIA